MATEELYNIRIIGLQKSKVKVLDYLHDKGILHISGVDERTNTFSLNQDKPIKKELEKISTALLELKWAIEYLGPYAKKKKDILLFKTKSLDKALDDVQDIKKSIHRKLSEIIKQMNHCSNEIESARNKISFLKNIPFYIDEHTQIEHDGPRIFSIIVEEQPIKKNMKSIIPDALKKFKGQVSYISKDAHSIIQGKTKDKETIVKALKEAGAIIIHIPKISTEKESEIRNQHKIISEHIKELKKMKKIIKDMSEGYYEKIAQLKHDLTIFHERYEITHNMHKTEKTFELQGYVSKREFKILKRMTDFIPVHIIAQEINKGPSKLWNISYVRHFEFITKMFGYPKYDTIDPTIFVALFLPFFFGFMFSDIGYGIMLLVLSFVLMMISQKENKVVEDAGIILFICSLSTIAFGLLFGSFFGNLIKIEPLLFDPFTNAKYILIAALSLGLIHLNLGMFIGIFEAIKKKDFRTILFEYISHFSLQAGALSLVLGFIYDPQLKLIGGVYIAVSILLFIIKNSLLGLMNISGFFGTWFSYARLLALSLATGGIALGINIMATQIGEIKFIGPLLFFLLITIGHIFNFIMNLLGSTIHSVRLHYIEFFSRFYEGGGKPFKVYTTERIKETL
jgi:V/A-type H+/Na+-transporting ATPase subunit I